MAFKKHPHSWVTHSIKDVVTIRVLESVPDSEGNLTSVFVDKIVGKDTDINLPKPESFSLSNSLASGKNLEQSSVILSPSDPSTMESIAEGLSEKLNIE